MKVANRLLIFLGVYVLTVLVLRLALYLYSLLLDDLFDGYPWDFILVCPAIIVITQLIFVLPMVKPPQLTFGGKSLVCSMILVSGIAATMTLSLFGLVYSLVISIMMDTPKQDFISELFFWLFLGVSWVVWSTCLLIYVHRKHKDPSTLVRVTSALFAGTLIEFLLSIPLTIMVERRTDCYCGSGTFIALCFSFLATIWLFGPFMIVVFIWRKRPWTKDHCFNCGYPRKLASSRLCSECGAVLQ